MTTAHRTLRWLPMAYLGLVFVYLLFPLLVVVPLSFGDEDLLRFPPRAFSLRWYDAYFGDPQWMRATALSFQVAVAASLAAPSSTACSRLSRSRYCARCCSFAPLSENCSSSTLPRKARISACRASS